jgi:hypothetical protein
MKFKLLFLTTVFSAAFMVRANADPGIGDENKKVDIAGGVIHAETKKPLSHVSVAAYSSTKKEKVVLTDGNGNYSFNDLKPGIYKLVFEKDGFKKVTKERVAIRPDEGFQLNVEMGEVEGFPILPGLLFSDF